MAREPDRTIEIEARVQYTTEKAWLVEDVMTDKQVWLAKSLGTMTEPANQDGVVLFEVKEWWAKKNGLI